MQIQAYLSLVKFSHTVFALPFALIGYTMGVLAVGFDWWIFVPVLLCMVCARNVAMGFNRVVDRAFDARNPRTASREIPAGTISVRAGKLFVFWNALLFIACCALFRVDGVWNPWPLLLSPVALGVVMGYSYMKRVTSLCHLVLGLGLAIAPSAAYLAVTGTLALAPVLLSLLVLTWVSGFDIIYALQDAGFDRSQNLHSIPARLGIPGALRFSVGLHLITAVMVVLIGWLAPVALVWYGIGAGCFLILLLYQHRIVKPDDLSRVGVAFGTTNGIASVVFAVFVIISLIVY